MRDESTRGGMRFQAPSENEQRRASNGSERPILLQSNEELLDTPRMRAHLFGSDAEMKSARAVSFGELI